jgi:hypothetical protein
MFSSASQHGLWAVTEPEACRPSIQEFEDLKSSKKLSQSFVSNMGHSAEKKGGRQSIEG